MTVSIQLRSTRTCLLAALLVTLLAACGTKAGGDKAAKEEGSGQVVAKVNDAEISVHQLNLAMSQVRGNIPQDKLQQVSKQALDRLIDQQVFVEKALEKKLDRDPKVVQQIEANRQQILAKAYVDSLIASTTSATREEVDTFYNAHPELFSQRRVYRLQQLELFSNPDAKTLSSFIAGAKDLGEVAKRLAEAKIGFNETTVTIAPEQLPMRLAVEFAKLQKGALTALPNPNGRATIAAILATQDAAVPRDKAQAAVEGFLNNQRRTQAVENELKSLKEKAKIVYLGNFDPKRAQEKAPDLGAAGPGTGAVTVDSKTLASDPAGVVTVNKANGGNEPSGVVTVAKPGAAGDASGVVTIKPSGDSGGVVTVNPSATKP